MTRPDKAGKITETFVVDGVTYQLCHKGGKHRPVEAFIKRDDRPDEPMKLDALPNPELVNQILAAKFGISSIEELASRTFAGIHTRLSQERESARN